MTAADPALAQAHDVANALLGAPARLERLAAGGRNSRIYRVCCGGREFALKQYPSAPDDKRDRLGTEVGALRLMERCRLDNVARVVGVDRERGYALLTWIAGTAVAEPTSADIDSALAFLGTIHGMRRMPPAMEQPLAAEACLAGAEIERQIDRRLAALRAASPQERNLSAFLDGAVVVALERAIAEARLEMRAAGLDFAAELPQEKRSLVPSDFGFHNSLRRLDGTLAYVDFEYFGWDDPVKLTADILLHPGMSLGEAQRARFQLGAQRLYGEDKTFAPRLRALLPLFAIRWTLILLNEFIPERWHRRVQAGAVDSWEAAKARQLARARDMMSCLAQRVED